MWDCFLARQCKSDEQTLICPFLWSVSCLKQPLLERFLNRAAEGFRNLFTAVEDHFELCLAKCRTSSQVRSWDTKSPRRQAVVRWHLKWIAFPDRCTTMAPVNLFYKMFVSERSTREHVQEPSGKVLLWRVSSGAASCVNIAELLGAVQKIWVCITIKLTLNCRTFKQAIAVLYVMLFTLHKCVELLIRFIHDDHRVHVGSSSESTSLSAHIRTF